MKFGGTSVKTAEAMQASAELVRAALDRRPLVVLSACGGMTDKLLSLAQAAANAEQHEMKRIFKSISDHHLQLCLSLLSTPESKASAILLIEELLNELYSYCEGIALLCECTPQSLDAVASYGERLSTTVFTTYLQSLGIDAALLDARLCMRTDNNFCAAHVIMSELEQRCTEQLLPLLQSHSCVVTQGFLGATGDGTSTTLGRGGSDLSAALFGAAIEANEIQIWTDVSGVLSSDPRLVANTHTIEEISFSEMRQLAYFGAKVLHPDTIKPALDRGVPVRIVNTFAPHDRGTVVVSDDHVRQQHSAGLRALSLLRRCVLVRKEVSGYEHASQVLSDMLSIAYSKGTEILLCFAEESSLGLVVRQDQEHLFSGHGRSIEPCEILCACGPALSLSDDSTRVTTLLHELDASVVLSGMSPVGILALIHPEHSVAALNRLHDEILGHKTT